MYDDDDNDKIMASMMNIIIMMNMMTMHSFVINVTMVKLTKTNMTMVITMGFSTICLTDAANILAIYRLFCESR